MPTTSRILHLGKKPYRHALNENEDLILFMKVEFAFGEVAFFTYAARVPIGGEINLDEMPDGAMLVAYYEPRSGNLRNPETTTDLDVRRYEKSRHRPLFQGLRRIGESRSRGLDRIEFLEDYRAENVPRRLRDTISL